MTAQKPPAIQSNAVTYWLRIKNTFQLEVCGKSLQLSSDRILSDWETTGLEPTQSEHTIISLKPSVMFIVWYLNGYKYFICDNTVHGTRMWFMHKRISYVERELRKCCLTRFFLFTQSFVTGQTIPCQLLHCHYTYLTSLFEQYLPFYPQNMVKHEMTLNVMDSCSLYYTCSGWQNLALLLSKRNTIDTWKAHKYLVSELFEPLAVIF